MTVSEASAATAGRRATPRSTGVRSTPSTWCRRCGSRSSSTTTTSTTSSTSIVKARADRADRRRQGLGRPGRHRRPRPHRRARRRRALARMAIETGGAVGAARAADVRPGGVRHARAELLRGPGSRAGPPARPGRADRRLAGRAVRGGRPAGPARRSSRSAATAAASCRPAATSTCCCCIQPSVPAEAAPRSPTGSGTRSGTPACASTTRCARRAEARRLASEDLRSVLGMLDAAARRRRRRR